MKQNSNLRSGRSLNEAHHGVFRAPRRWAAAGEPITLVRLEPDEPIAEGMIPLELPIEPSARLALQVADAQCTVADLVPAARELADLLVGQTVEQAREAGESVPCRKGCDACCSYLVPLSAPEAAALWDALAALPAHDRQTFEQGFDKAGRQLLENPPPWIDGACQPSLGDISSWYLEADISCPLLSHNACAHYTHRPIACREHLVTSPPSQCGAGGLAATPAPLPVSVAEALSEVSARLQGAATSSIMMPLAMHFVHDNPQLRRRLYPARLLAQQLASSLQRQAKPLTT